MFARAASTYWLGVFPGVCRELRSWRARAAAIPDPLLRAHASAALAKRGNMEGAAAFATFVPRPHRAAVIRATVAFQAAYNHLDVLSEQPAFGGVEQALALHQALLHALSGGGGEDVYREIGVPCARAGGVAVANHADGGYLAALLSRCRLALATLPSWPHVRPAALRAAERVVAFQSLNRGDHAELERWARAVTPAHSGLRWWETAACAGSSLGVHATIAAAGSPIVEVPPLDSLERAYSPWIGALHSLLDQLIDIAEDASTGQPNLIACYSSVEEAAERMAWLASRALESARGLDPPARHELIVAAMASFYLATPEAFAGEAAVVSGALLSEFGGLVSPGLAVFRVRAGLAGVAGFVPAAVPRASGRRMSPHGSPLASRPCGRRERRFARARLARVP